MDKMRLRTNAGYGKMQGTGLTELNGPGKYGVFNVTKYGSEYGVLTTGKDCCDVLCVSRVNELNPITHNHSGRCVWFYEHFCFSSFSIRAVFKPGIWTVLRNKGRYFRR